MSTNRIPRRATVAAVGVTTLVAGPATASAAPANTSTARAPEMSAQAGVPDSCFGYAGTFLAGSKRVKVDWNRDGKVDECFGIAPNRHIYHAWPGHPWVEMPHNGRADDVAAAATDVETGHHAVIVWIKATKQDYYSELIGTWQPWKLSGLTA